MVKLSKYLTGLIVEYTGFIIWKPLIMQVSDVPTIPSNLGTDTMIYINPFI